MKDKNPLFKMKMGSKEKDTPGSMSEKDSALLKMAPMYKYNDSPMTAPGDMYRSEKASAEMAANAPSEYDKMGAAFEKGQADGDALASAMSGGSGASADSSGEEKKKKIGAEDFLKFIE
tara:strand:- start:481 stop:837 length:357 start_codon:yes stop_codon:yes gene_type:complete